MANGYSTNTMQPARNQMAGIPQRSLSMILVDETTPNLEEIQSFPVIYRNGNVHIHQDPSTSQMYQMTDEFHSRIPQILAERASAMTGGVMPPAMRGGALQTKIISVPEVIDRFTTTPSQQVFFDLLSRSGNLNQLSTTTNLNMINRRPNTFNTSQVINPSIMNLQFDTISSQNDLNQMEFSVNSIENNSMSQRPFIPVIKNGAIQYAYPMIRSVQVSTTNIVPYIVNSRFGNRYTYPKV